MSAITEEKEQQVNAENLEENEGQVSRKQFVVFQIGSEEYGVIISQAKGIIKPKKITNVPNTAEHVLGVINLRGQIVPVVDLKKKFHIAYDKSKNTEDQRIITVEVNDTLIGIFVDGVNEVVWLEEDTIEPAPEVAGGIKQEYLLGIGKIEDRLLVLVDLRKLLFDDTGEEDNT